MLSISSFKQKKRYLVCIDSDGCAIDAMTIKHKKAFGPAAVEIWDLHTYEQQFLKLWDQLNLYSATRGINRFKGLVMSFEIMEARGYTMPNISKVRQWSEDTHVLSSESLEKKHTTDPDDQYAKVLAWSHRVNELITKLEGKYHAFEFVQQSLSELMDFVDIAIVSSANRGAVEKEWEEEKLSSYVSVMCTQEDGSKKACIEKLLENNNYDKDCVLMIGDAFGDEDATICNGILFYPIIAQEENDSWRQFLEQSLEKFKNRTYKGAYEESLKKRFHSKLQPLKNN